MSVRNLVSLVVVLLLSLFIVPRASAHGRTPRLEISAERMNPGGVLDIRGVEFDYEELVTLYLERQGTVVSLGEINADLEGIFIHTIVLPADLPAGEYTVRGVTEHHDVLSPIFSVQGSAISNEGGGQGSRDDDDGLLAPMPTYAPRVIPGGVSQPSVQPSPEKAPAPSRTLMIFLILILGVTAILSVSRSRVARKSQ
jgi:hypothetical protein